MSPVSTVMRSASSFITGNAPGSPRQTGQVCVFGSAPNSTGEPQNILDRVLSCTCTSRPSVAMYFILNFSHDGHQGSQRKIWRIIRIQMTVDYALNPVL